MSWVLVVDIILFAAAIFCYRLGGSDIAPKSVRRIGVAVCVGVSRLIKLNWIGLASVPLVFGALTLGYGENSKLLALYRKIFDDGLAKFFTRLTCGLAYTLAAGFILWGNWWLLGWHVLCGTAGIVLAGTQKFKVDAEREESIIGALITFAPIFMG